MSNPPKTDSPIKRGDAHQYEAQPHEGDPRYGVQPTVYLLNMTSDPLGTMAAHNGIYEGIIIRSLSEVTDEMRYQVLADMQRGQLLAPLEAVDLHFVIDGVDRAFTHQLVRQRTANYAQESMRFAVLGDLKDATTLPPQIQGTDPLDPEFLHSGYNEVVLSRDYTMASEQQRMRMKWDWLIEQIDDVYHSLVHAGMPAEEARGLLPHCTATRIHYETDLRAMIPHAGNRLCTQAQFHWRSVFMQIVHAIRNFVPEDHPHRWQYEAISKANWFRPACYQQGKCPFKATADRSCTIRDRVDAFAKHGIPSDKWHEGAWVPEAGHLEGINPAEWALDPGAARS